MVALGLPDHRWVQNNIGFNAERSFTYGVHAGPRDKCAGVATGSVLERGQTCVAGQIVITQSTG